MRKLAVRAIRLLLMAYVALVAFLYLFQSSLLYAPWGTPKPVREYEGLEQFEQVTLTAQDGNATFGWFSPPPSEDAKTIVFFHGNGGNLSLWAHAFSVMHQQGFGVLALEYRGYGGAAGKTGEQNFYSDARAAIDFLIQDQHIPAANIILMGHSLGSGIAVQMATEYALGGVVLISPYRSVADVAASRFPLVPVDLLLRERFDSIDKIAHVEEPILIFHGSEDSLIPPAQSQALFDAATARKERVVMEGINHDNVDFDVMIPQMAEWLKRLSLP